MTTVKDYINSIRKSLAMTDELIQYDCGIAAWKMPDLPARNRLRDAQTELAEVAKILGIELETDA